MADRLFTLNDLLCFVFNKYGKTNLKTLKSIVSNFYSVDTIGESKIVLFDDVMKISLTDKPPHIPRRRDGDGRLNREVDDLFILLNFIDEKGLRDKLPHYVTEKPDELPGVHLCDGDMKVFVSWLEKMEARMDRFDSTMAAIATSVHSLRSFDVRSTINTGDPQVIHSFAVKQNVNSGYK